MTLLILNGIFLAELAASKPAPVIKKPLDLPAPAGDNPNSTAGGGKRFRSEPTVTIIL